LPNSINIKTIPLVFSLRERGELFSTINKEDKGVYINKGLPISLLRKKKKTYTHNAVQLKKVE